ncbi:MAG: hypothetical protein LQ345_004554 [Seirophora villosa]|nr:MAG: hypothetical protein LQ345_004554 [Seirophora villosa]
MDPLVLNAMIPGTSVDEDSADISSKSTPAEFSKTETCESQTPKTAVNFLDFRDVFDVVSGKQRLKAYQAVAADLQGGLWV